MKHKSNISHRHPQILGSLILGLLLSAASLTAQEIDLSRKYLITRDGQIQEGPFTLEKIKELALPPNTMVWYEGVPQWTALSKMPELAPGISHFKIAKMCETTAFAYEADCFSKIWFALQDYVYVNMKLIEAFDTAERSFESLTRYATIASLTMDEAAYFLSILPKVNASVPWENPVKSEQQKAWLAMLTSHQENLQSMIQAYQRILDTTRKQLAGYEAKLLGLEKKIAAAAERNNVAEYEKLLKLATEIDPTFQGKDLGQNFMSMVLKTDVKYKIPSTDYASGWVDMQVGAFKKSVPVAAMQSIALETQSVVENGYKLGESVDFRFAARDPNKPSKVDQNWRYATAGMMEISFNGFYIDPMISGASAGMFTGRVGLSGFPVNVFHFGAQIAPTWNQGSPLGVSGGLPLGFTFDLKKFFFDLSVLYGFNKSGSNAVIHSVQGSTSLKFSIADHILFSVGVETGITVGKTGNKSSGVMVPFGISIAF